MLEARERGAPEVLLVSDPPHDAGRIEVHDRLTEFIFGKDYILLGAGQREGPARQILRSEKVRILSG